MTRGGAAGNEYGLHCRQHGGWAGHRRDHLGGQDLPVPLRMDRSACPAR